LPALTKTLALAAVLVALLYLGGPSSAATRLRPVAGVPATNLGALEANNYARALRAWGASTGGTDCTKDPAGNVVLDGSYLKLSTSGAVGNCGKIDSPAAYGYGTYQARFRVSGSDSIAQWPAFWGSGPDWPHHGELDAFEGLGGTDEVHFHCGASYRHEDTITAAADVSRRPGWYTVDVISSPGRFAVYTDGVLTVTVDTASLPASAYVPAPLTWIFDITSAGAGPPAHMLVAYFRYWARKSLFQLSPCRWSGTGDRPTPQRTRANSHPGAAAGLARSGGSAPHDSLVGLGSRRRAPILL
jgi:hypothetical protein